MHIPGCCPPSWECQKTSASGEGPDSSGVQLFVPIRTAITVSPTASPVESSGATNDMTTAPNRALPWIPGMSYHWAFLQIASSRPYTNQIE